MNDYIDFLIYMSLMISFFAVGYNFCILANGRNREKDAFLSSRFVKLDDVIDIIKQCTEKQEMLDKLNFLKTLILDDDDISRDYVIKELQDLLDEFAETNEEGLHNDRWCGISDAIQVLKSVPSTTELDEQH